MIEPTHPLYGLRLPLVEVANKPRLGRACVVWVQPGVERLVPVAATDLSGGAPLPHRCRLSVPAIRALLAAVASVSESLGCTLRSPAHRGRFPGWGGKT